MRRINMTFDLIIFDSESANVAAMKASFSGMGSITVLQTERMLYLEPPPNIDVLYLPLAASAKWGSRPLVHLSQVLPTTAEDQEKGLPAFVVTGCCLAPSDPRGPVPEMTLLLNCVFDAIRAFNDENNFKLRRIGFWGYDLLRGLSPDELKSIVVRVVPELTR